MSRAGLHVAAAVVCCAPFVPMLFAGEEWGASTPFQYFTDHTDPELGRAVTAGRRREFAVAGREADVPDPQAEGTWLASRLRWQECGEPAAAELLGWYRDLLRLRRDEVGLTDSGGDRVEVTPDEGHRVLVMRRGGIVLALHAGTGPARVAVPAGARAVLAWPPDGVHHGEGEVSFDGEGVAVLRV
jgi:maltooligosyltrehalose trehalohydrolase